MTSSSAILYPNLRGIEQSNSSFIQVSPPVKEIKRNSSSNHRNVVPPKSDRGIKFKSKRDEPKGIEEKFFDSKRHGNITNISENEYVGYHKDFIEISTNDKDELLSNGESNTKLKIDKSQQYSILELDEKKDEINTVETALSNTGEEPTTSLVKSETLQNALKKQPNQMIIINNNFFDRPNIAHDEFMSKVSQTFNNNNANVQSLLNAIPSIIKEIKNDDLDTVTESQGDATDYGFSKENTISNFLTEANDVSKSIPIDKDVPIGSIITAILWIILILFWFLLYLKVLSVYNKPSYLVIPTPEPTNYELCLMYLRKFGLIIGRLWKF